MASAAHRLNIIGCKLPGPGDSTTLLSLQFDVNCSRVENSKVTGLCSDDLTNADSSAGSPCSFVNTPLKNSHQCLLILNYHS